MPKIDINPVGSGGKVDPTDADGWKQALGIFAGLSVFMTILFASQDAGNYLYGRISSGLGLGSQKNSGNDVLGEF